MTARKRWGAFGALARGVGARRSRWPAQGSAAPRRNAASPIVIGWAFDSKGKMAPFDGPALAAAKIRDRPDQREGRRQRAAAPDRHLRHEQQQPGQGEVVRGEPARQGRARSSSRRATSTSRRRSCRSRSSAASSTIAPCIGTDQMGPKRFGKAGQARVQLRQRRPGRGLGDGRVRVSQGLADGRPGHEHAARLLQERRPGVRQAVHAARRQDRRPRELRDRGEQRQRPRSAG